MLDGKIVLVTGASRGIGKAIALTLGGSGATVIGTATSDVGADNISKMLVDNEISGKGIVLDVRDNDFEITFTYKSNNKEFEHVLKIVEYENTTYGSAFSSDYYLTYNNETTDNKYINALNTATRFPHLKAEKESYLMKESEWTNYETTITYTFLNPAKGQYHGLGNFKDTKTYQP